MSVISAAFIALGKSWSEMKTHKKEPEDLSKASRALIYVPTDVYQHPFLLLHRDPEQEPKEQLWI